VLALAGPLVAAAAPAQAAPKTQATSGEIHLATVTSSTALAHTIRHADGTWDHFGTLQTANVDPTRLTSALLNGEEHLLYQTTHQIPAFPVLNHRVRHADGSWEWVTPGFAGPTAGVAAAAVAGELHVVRRSESRGPVEHRTRRADGTWTAVSTVPIDAEWTGGHVVAGSGGDLHVMFVHSPNIEFSHLIRYADGTWSPTTNVFFTPATGRISAYGLKIAQVGAELHAVSVGSNSKVYHAVRRADGSWQDFRDIGPVAGTPGTPADIAVAAAGSALQLVLSTTEGGLYHSIRFADGSWQRFGDVKGEAGSVPSGELTLAGG
jgi:hypothetical protein